MCHGLEVSQNGPVAYVHGGSLTCFIGGPFNRLGVSTTGGLPNVALGLTFGAGVGDAGVVVAVVLAGSECSGGGSWVGIL